MDAFQFSFATDAPNNGQTQQQKQQACLDKTNNSPDGKFYNFFIAASPWLAPCRLQCRRRHADERHSSPSRGRHSQKITARAVRNTPSRILRIRSRARSGTIALGGAKFARNFPLTAENPHSLQQGTNRHNFTQLQAQQNKATYNKVFQGRPIRPKLFHVEQFGFPSRRGAGLRAIRCRDART